MNAQALFRQAKFGVSISGAGLSVASGLPTYRTEGGIWQGNDPAMLTQASLERDPLSFWSFFHKHWVSMTMVSPNPAHQALAEMEREGWLKTHITQNVDRLLTDAGARNVIELHGHLRTACCLKCGQMAPMPLPRANSYIPRCACRGLLRPNVVMYGDRLNETHVRRAREAINEADVILIVGTSLEVDPLAGMMSLRQLDAHVIVVDPYPPDLGEESVIYITEPAELALPRLIAPV